MSGTQGQGGYENQIRRISPNVYSYGSERIVDSEILSVTGKIRVDHAPSRIENADRTLESTSSFTTIINNNKLPKTLSPRHNLL